MSFRHTVVGLVVTLLAVMLGFFGVSAIEIEEVRGNRFFSFRQAMAFSFKRLGQIFLSELAVVLFLAFVVLLFFIFGLITRIPFLGEWLFAVFFVLPNFIIAFIVIVILTVLIVSLLLLPSVSAAERHGETFTSILETFSTVIRQPMRWLGYTAYGMVAAKLAGFVYAYFCYRAVQFVTLATSLGGGEKIKRLVYSALDHLPVKTDLVREVCNIFPGIDWSFSIARWLSGGSNTAAGYLMSFMLLVIFASVVARGYVIIRYIKDNYKITEEDPLFYKEEHVNPPIEGEGEVVE